MSRHAITVRTAAWAACLLLPSLASAQALSPPPMEAEIPMASASATQAAVMATTTLEVLSDVQVTQIGTYQDTPTHFVWFTKRGPQCALEANPVHRFSDDKASGAALHATLMTALVNQRKLDVRVNGCQIYEVYLR
ncbi:hypothetical protein [Pseudoxanthomonas wuyuanensis]|uniref:Beta/Gamma crystallin n=1 Tax=Pseudoxanthomonas wuyuanensis TaxID=1073196 RepID=A0A286DBQ0_9GAMM|nr:hypothetical protein [Pseudoxanthomonas wuyuanensis]SOD56032.1 hypothetical protein SAMN06296416_108141 [Pseudoxanthomonas wuyuanensis]